MFDFGNANDGQRQAISTTEGPVLITAGPGTGKTYTLVQRAIYLIEERGVKPEDIFIATFTEKAAKELITRITNELASRNITVNVNEMYVGTFHSLCLRIIKDHLEYTRLKKNYRLLDTFDQQYLVFRNIYKFRTISGIENVMPKGGAWKWAQAICEFSNNLTEEVVDIDAMLSDHDMEISVIAKVVNTYQAMLDEENLMDFSAIQTECYRLLKENKDILEDLRNSIKYIMVDEYQDTNYIQEQTIFLLGTHENICVVGDDDQGLYRFRGATIRNILEFPSKFDVGKCQIIPLVINYRSDSDIVEFYNKWMITTSGSKFKFEWDKFRYDKRIVANETSKIESPCVVKLASKDDEDEWHERVLDFINRLKNSGKIQDYNQLAFLFSSVKHERVISLARFLESNHINVYSPRSDMFFRREEVMQALGCMMLMFPNYVKGLENGEYKFLDNNGNPVSDWWDDIVPLNPVASERTDYPTQKPEQLLERIVEAATNRGDLVFDCFMGSGTTQSVAMKLGRRFIGADINLGAIQTTTKRLINVASELDGQLQEEIKYTGFEVYNVNNYDFFRNPIEAKNLIIEALEVQPFTQGNVWDGELDGRMVKIMPVNRIATKADLEELKANLPYKTYEKRKEENPRQPVELITIICMGHEPDLKASLEQSLSEYKVDVQIVDILRDKSELQLKREAEAEVVREGNKLVIRSFYPMNLMQKLSLQKEYVEDWKQLVESIMIDWNYDGVVMQPMVTDVPDKKEFVAGIYDIPEDAGTIKVKITDLLSESLEVEV